MKNLRRVFVYGTLKRGMSNSKCIPDKVIAKIAEGKTTGTLYYVCNGAFPCLKLHGNKNVYGEVYEIKPQYWDKTLERMDELEGCPMLYTREIIEVQTAEGFVKCWAYIFNADNLLGDEIEDGIFKGRQIKNYEYFNKTFRF